jgi:hypothetical protein
MTDLSVTWIDLPIGTTSREKLIFRCIKDYSELIAAILRSDLSSSMCGLQVRRYKCNDSEIEGTSAGNILSLNGSRASAYAFTIAISPLDR